MTEYLANKTPFSILTPEDRWTPDLARGQQSIIETGDELIHLPPLVKTIRKKVFEWRNSNYEGASQTSKALLNHWFSAPHIRYKPDGETFQFQWYYGQREAVETLIYLYDVARIQKQLDLMRFSSKTVTESQFDSDWLKLCSKMATGTGKTKVMSLMVVWSYFHKMYEVDSRLSTNFLIIAPNVIVLDRLKGDFENRNIFNSDPLIPDAGFEGFDWDFQLSVHIGAEVSHLSNQGNLFLTNIQKIYTKASDQVQSLEEKFLGKKAVLTTNESQLEVRQMIRDLDELMILNDEAHHVWDDKLAWNQTLQSINDSMLDNGSSISLQVDLTATPKNPNGKIFPHVVSDFPLVEAIALDIVKRPVVPDEASQLKLQANDLEKGIAKKYADHLKLGIQEFKRQYEHFKGSGRKPVMFVMVPVTNDCADVVTFLENDELLRGKVYEIHTKADGSISEGATKKNKDELAKMRSTANTMDTNEYLAIVSVMMLKEGWDVSNITTVIGLRNFTSKGKILPEQALGRGLRKMVKGTRDREEVLVIGSDAFMEFINELTKEGVVFTRRNITPGDSPEEEVVEVKVKPPDKANPYEIKYPILQPRFIKKERDLGTLDLSKIPNKIRFRQYSKEELREITWIDKISGEERRKTIFDVNTLPQPQMLIGGITTRIANLLKINSGYDLLYPKVYRFLEHDLFNKKVDLDDWNTIKNISDNLQFIINTVVEQVNKLPILESESNGIKKWVKISDSSTVEFRSKIGYMVPQKSAFQKIAGDSGFENTFALFLDRARDVKAFAKNYQSKSSAKFEPLKIEYQKSDGTLANYYPDFFVKINDNLSYIVETKGQQDIDDLLKFARLEQWCDDANKVQDKIQFKCLYIQQKEYEKYELNYFDQLITIFSKSFRFANKQ